MGAGQVGDGGVTEVGGRVQVRGGSPGAERAREGRLQRFGGGGEGRRGGLGLGLGLGLGGRVAKESRVTWWGRVAQREKQRKRKAGDKEGKAKKQKDFKF